MSTGSPDLRVVANDVVGCVAAGVVGERLPLRAALWLPCVQVQRAQWCARGALWADVTGCGHVELGFGGRGCCDALEQRNDGEETRCKHCGSFEEYRCDSLGFVRSDGSGCMLRASVGENGKGISQTRQQPILILCPEVLQRSVINAEQSILENQTTFR